jgi:hypothetical protein
MQVRLSQYVKGLTPWLICASSTDPSNKTQPSIHLTRKSAFAGVATRKDALLVTIKLPGDIASSRIVKRQRTSANRWHLDVRLESPKEIDRELKSWLKDAMELSA